MIFGKTLNRSQFYLSCVIYYGILFITFYLIDKPLFSLPDNLWIKAPIWFLSVTLIYLLLGFPDFLWLNYSTHKNRSGTFRGFPIFLSKGEYYLRVILFYGSLVLIGFSLLKLKGLIHVYAYYYLIILFASYFFRFMHYLIPEYKRYRELRDKNQFNTYP